MELAGTEPPAPMGTPLNPAADGYALTADGNIVHTRAILRYRFDDPLRCVFGFAGDTNQTYNLVGVSNAVQNALNNALLHSAARFTVDEILTRDVLGFQDAVRRRFEQLEREQDLGVAVEQCEVQSRPPRQLKQAFDNVITAGLNRSKVMNEALSYANQITNRAASEAASAINGASAERTRYLQDLAAETERFRGLLPKFEANPDLFMQQRLIETMGRVMTNAQDKIYLPERADGKTRELRLLLNREPQKPRVETQP
jgi:modulator of FtsH protease HflK